MTTILLITHLFVLLAGMVLGSRLRSRRRYNAGVAKGREFECTLHGWHDDPALAVESPSLRRWVRMNRKRPTAEPAPPPRPVFHDPAHH
jgi:hypothetical protein